MAASVNRCRRVWLWWAIWSLLPFTYLEARGYRRGCHMTLSRELRTLLGGRGCWAFTALGAVLTLHLIRLSDLVETEPEESCRAHLPP